MKKVFLGVAVVAALLSSCATANKSVSLDGEWNIVSVEGQKVVSEQEPFIGFDTREGRLYGNAGCNNIMASISLDTIKGSVTLSEVGATRKMCRDMKLEGQVLAALEKVSSYRSSENGVELVDARGNVVFGLEKKAAAVANVEDLEGEWFISAVNGKAVEVVEKTPFIVINVAEKTVHGTAGCNIFNGGFSQKKDNPASFSFGELVTTMMAGPGMEQERTILDVMAGVRGFEKQADGTISLIDENNESIVELTKNTGKSLAE